MKRFFIVTFLIILAIVGIEFYTIYRNESKEVELKPVISQQDVDSLSKREKSESIEKVYIKLMNDYKLPFYKIDRIDIVNAYSPIDLIFPKKLEKEKNEQILQFINETSNFTWGETTFDDATTILYLYAGGKLAYKMWFGNESRVLKIEPTYPNAKFGMMTLAGYEKFKEIIKPARW